MLSSIFLEYHVQSKEANFIKHWVVCLALLHADANLFGVMQLISDFFAILFSLWWQFLFSVRTDNVIYFYLFSPRWLKKEKKMWVLITTVRAEGAKLTLWQMHLDCTQWFRPLYLLESFMGKWCRVPDHCVGGLASRWNIAVHSAVFMFFFVRLNELF